MPHPSRIDRTDWGLNVLPLMVVALLVASCSRDGMSELDAYAGAVYGVEVDACGLRNAFGSGVGVAPGLVVTSAHTVAGARTVTVHDEAGRSLPASLVAFDPDLDVSVLAVDGPVSWIPHRAATNDEHGQMLTWSREAGPRSSPISETRRISVQIEDIYLAEISTRPAIEFNGEVRHGDSGGAVVGDDGQLIGVVYAASRERAVGFALRAEALDAVLMGMSDAHVDPGPCTK